MHIKSFKIKNFKSFKDVTIHFNNDLNILTGANNSGKTTVLEAISLWHECFSKLISKAKGSEKNYKKGDWILGPTSNKYFPFDQINSVRSPFFEDIFYQRIKTNNISLSATLVDGTDEIEVSFLIGSSGANYVIRLANYSSYSFKRFNNFFGPAADSAIGIVYASPVAVIESSEEFCTTPVIADKILQRQSFQVLRNRIYKLLASSDTPTAERFLADLNYILFDRGDGISLFNRSNIQQDRRVLIRYKINRRGDTEKDLALLGSGSLQTIEILLNLYNPGEPSRLLSIILLDEPDSHIHRDIQARLILVLKKFGVDKQIFISTHNEALIRNADYQHVFHMSGKNTDEVSAISNQEIARIQPHFKGIYPAQINPVMRSIGSATGLDFINAIECDRLIFVEGEDDAKIVSLLLRNLSGNKKKYMFWVMGGISEVFENIVAYRTVFSNIRNGKTLWEKSALIFDKDFLTDEHRDLIVSDFSEKLGLVAASISSYTFESSLFTDIDKLTILIGKWFTLKKVTYDQDVLTTELFDAYSEYKRTLEDRVNDTWFENTIYEYRNRRDKAKEIFGRSPIKQNDVQLSSTVRTAAKDIFATGDIYKLMKKDDVGFVINKVTSMYSLTFSIETDFIELIKLVDKGLWFNEWDVIIDLGK